MLGVVVVAVVVVALLGSDADADAEVDPPMSAKPDAEAGDGASGRKWIDVFFFKMLLGGSDWGGGVGVCCAGMDLVGRWAGEERGEEGSAGGLDRARLFLGACLSALTPNCTRR